MIKVRGGHRMGHSWRFKMKSSVLSLIFLFTFTSVAATHEYEENLMPEITHASDSTKTYSTPTTSVGRKEESKNIGDLQHDEHELHANQVNENRSLHHN